MYISQLQRCCDPQGRLLIVGLAAEIGDRLITFSFLRSLFQLFRFISFFATIKMCAKKKAVEAVECWLMSEVLESLVMGDVSEGTR